MKTKTQIATTIIILFFY